MTWSKKSSPTRLSRRLWPHNSKLSFSKKERSKRLITDSWGDLTLRGSQLWHIMQARKSHSLTPSSWLIRDLLNKRREQRSLQPSKSSSKRSWTRMIKTLRTMLEFRPMLRTLMDSLMLKLRLQILRNLSMKWTNINITLRVWLRRRGLWTSNHNLLWILSRRLTRRPKPPSTKMLSFLESSKVKKSIWMIRP